MFQVDIIIFTSIQEECEFCAKYRSECPCSETEVEMEGSEKAESKMADSGSVTTESNMADSKMAAVNMAPKTFDELLPLAGEWGRYQMFLFMTTLPFYIFFSFVYYTQIFLTESPKDYWCYIPELANLTVLERKSLAIPQTENGFSKCMAFNANWSQVLMSNVKPDVNSTVKCQNGWEYNMSDIPYTTISSEMDWVCERDNYQASAQSLFFVGSVIGGLIFGSIGDKYGRIPGAVCANLVACLGGIASAYTTNFWQFSLTRFIVGLSYDNCLMMIYILVIEYTAPKYRTAMSNASFAIFYTFATCSLPWIALACDGWRKLSIVISAPMALALLTPFIVPESPRWLLSKGRIDEAIEKLRSIGQVNKKIVPEKMLEDFKLSAKQDTTTDCNLKDIFQTPILRATFLLISILFMITSIIFDTLVRVAGDIGDDFFVSFTIVSLTEFPSLMLLVFVMDWLGRRWMTGGALAICCVFNILAAFVPKGPASLTCVVISRFVVNMAFNGAIQWAAELLPSGARGSGVSLVHMFGYIATIISPYIVYLETVKSYLPLLITGLLSAIGCIISLSLTETSGKSIPQTKQDAINLIRDHRFLDMPFRKKSQHAIATSGYQNTSFELES